MRRGHCFLILCGWSLLSSCHKNVAESKTPLVASYRNSGENCSTICTYDDDGRLLSAVSCMNIESYSYYDDSVVLRYSENGLEKYRYAYMLDSKKVATGYLRYADNTVTVYHFLYDADGIRTSIKQDGDTGTYKIYTIDKKNVVRETSRSSTQTAGNSDITTSYFAETINNIGNANFGRTFLGKSSENLKKGETWDTPDGIFAYQFKYELDDNSLVHKRVKMLNGADTAEVRFYEYR